MARFRGFFPILLLVAFGATTGLGLLEAASRLWAVREERKEGRLDRDLADIQAPRRGAVVTLGQIIQRSKDPRIVYELRPRLDVVFAGARVTTSDGGFRGPDVSARKPPDLYRIVGIGDSYMFGQGVSDQETYLSRLPLLLQGADGRTFETVNMAVPGFNTVMETELLRTRAANLEPDLVLIEVVGNDLDLPNFLWNTLDPFSLRHSFLFDFVRSRLGATRAAQTRPRGLSQAPPDENIAEGKFARDESQVPPQYASMVGLDAFRQAVRELAQVGRDRHIPVLALSHGVWFEDEMLKVMTQNDIPVLILRSALRQRARALGAPDYARSALALSPTDLHPSALGHVAISEELALWLNPRIQALARHPPSQKTKPTEASQPLRSPRSSG